AALAASLDRRRARRDRHVPVEALEADAGPREHLGEEAECVAEAGEDDRRTGRGAERTEEGGRLLGPIRVPGELHCPGQRMADRVRKGPAGEEPVERAAHREGAAASFLEEERQELAVAAVRGRRAERAG